MRTVTVELAASGFFDHAVEFRDGDQIRRTLGEGPALGYNPATAVADPN